MRNLLIFYHQILSQNGAGHTYGNGSCSLPMAPPGAVIINGGHPGPGGRGAEPEHHSVCLKWTPNRLMNGGTVEDKSASWQQAVAIDMKDIIFMHCHQVCTVYSYPLTPSAVAPKSRHYIAVQSDQAIFFFVKLFKVSLTSRTRTRMKKKAWEGAKHSR